MLDKPDKLLGESLRTVSPSLRRSPFDENVLAFDVAVVSKTLT